MTIENEQKENIRKLHRVLLTTMGEENYKIFLQGFLIAIYDWYEAQAHIDAIYEMIEEKENKRNVNK